MAEEKPLSVPELQVTLVTGERIVYEGVADRVVAPAVNGQITILPRHAALLAMLEPGELLLCRGADELSFAVGGGFIEVLEDRVIVLADTAEEATEIDAARAEAARKRAAMLVRAYRERPEFAAADQALRRSRARLKVARRVRRST